MREVVGVGVPVAEPSDATKVVGLVADPLMVGSTKGALGGCATAAVDNE